MCRAPMPRPSGWFRMVSAGSTAGQLSSGSPIPMNTTLVGCEVGMTQDDLPRLPGDLERREVAPEAHAAGRAEDAAQRASRLGGDAQGAATLRGDQHRLDRLAVGQAPEKFPGPVRRLLLRYEVESGEGKSFLQRLPEGERKLGRVGPGRDRSLPETAEELAGTIRRETLVPLAHSASRCAASFGGVRSSTD